MDPGSRSWRNWRTLGHARYRESDTCFEIWDDKKEGEMEKILSFPVSAATSTASCKSLIL